MRVEFHPATVSDLNEAVAYYNGQRPGLGDALRSELYTAIDRIVAGPAVTACAACWSCASTPQHTELNRSRKRL